MPILKHFGGNKFAILVGVWPVLVLLDGAKRDRVGGEPGGADAHRGLRNWSKHGFEPPDGGVHT